MSGPSVPEVDVSRAEYAGSAVVHCLLPPWRESEAESVAAPHSIAVALTWPTAAVVRNGSGAARPVRVFPGDVGLGGGDPLRWLATDAPSDVVEVTASEALRVSVADETGAAAHAGLVDLHGFTDPAIVAIGLRFRAALRGGVPLGPLEADTLVRAMFARALVAKLGGRLPARRHRLSSRQLDRVLERLATPGLPPATVPELAAAASMSPFHFLRSFTRTTGITPHRMQTLLLLERSRGALLGGATVAEAAVTAGYENLSWFRRLFRLHYGALPSIVARDAGPGTR